MGLIARENSTIRFFFIGDVNQAIYGGIGGAAKNKTQLDELFGTPFQIELLDGCYRSTQRIINFYSHFQVALSDISAESDLKDELGMIFYNRTIDRDDLTKSIASIISEQLERGVPEREICVIAPQWWLLYPVSKSLRALLPNVSFDAPDMTPIKYDPMSVFYRISQLKFSEAGKNTGIRKRIANEVISILSDDYKIHLPDHIDCYLILKCVNAAEVCNTDGIKTLINTINSLFLFCDISLEQEVQLKKAYVDFFNKVNQRIVDYSLTSDMDTFKKCFKEKNGVVINSYHGVKGEEYTTVIAFGCLNGYIPNWDLIYSTPEKRKSETRKLIYVVCSRAKKNLFLFSEHGRITKKGYSLDYCKKLAVNKSKSLLSR